MMRPAKWNHWLIPFFCVLLCCVLFFGFGIYRNSLTLDLNQDACQTLFELLEQQRFNFSARVDADMKSIKNLAKIARYLPSEREEAVRVGASLVDDTNFDYLLLTDQTGHGISSTGLSVDLSERSFFQSAIRGQTIVSEPRMSSIEDAVVLPLTTPIYLDDQVCGVLAGAYNINDLQALFLPAYQGKAFTCIVNETGDMICKSPGAELLFSEGHLFDTLSQANFLKNGSLNGMRDDMKNQNEGHADFSLQGSRYLMHYAPLGINNWSILMLVPEDIISAQASSISKNTVILTSAVLFFFLLFALYTLWMQRKSSAEKFSNLSELETAAYYDSLTGLPNLNKLKKDAAALLLTQPEQRFAILKFDIQNFKVVNEMFGFESGNTVICSLSDFISQACRAQDFHGLLARVTADEFIVFGEASALMLPVSHVPPDLTEKLHKTFGSILGPHRIEFRCGRYLLSPGEQEINGVLEKVNLAHRIAKKEKGTQICDYDEHFKANVLHEVQIENKMEGALTRGEFIVYLQPKYELVSETVVGAEALVRWLEPDGTLVSPGEFIPLFEKNRFVLKLDLYVFERVCALLRTWLDEERPMVPISVNFSKLHLGNPRLVSELAEIADRYQVPRKYIEIELTESIIFNNEEILQQLLHTLHDKGFTLSMDDFGTGYSSLGLLKNLPVDVIKMDRMFFSNSMYKGRAKMVIESVMQMAEKLNICTVAEGVEEQEDIDFLREVGCDIVQGFYYSRPIPAADFAQSFSIRPIPSAPPLPDIAFHLSQLGDVVRGRALLGEEMPVFVYRLFNAALRESLTKQYGRGEMVALLRTCGISAGRSFAADAMDISLPIDAFFEQLRQIFLSSKLGILELESHDPLSGAMVFTVQDDLDCSGMSDSGDTMCQYDEGLIAGILYEYTKTEYSVLEVDCWANGSKLCRFEVRRK